ncbi:MAG: ABC transporter ATP-binding protein, partial [candidate division Zixibacteria bacterium]|nr:ABC transporter ATP-binding protein [candidate division Zixibacteria bacterium]
FIDTPVKHYSSGMHVRLAFAVAAHLEPEILLVDEVLAVGDFAFQQKCLGKMRNVAAEGRTVLFVSHNMGAIRSLCQRAICLDKGEVTLDDQADRLVSYYLGQNTVEGAMVSSEDIEARMEPTKKQKEPYIRIKKIAILDQTRALREWFYSDEEIVISIIFKCFKPVRDLRVVASVV